MSESVFKRVRELTAGGLHYDNLVEMAALCRQESDSHKILSAYILNRVLSEMADQLGDGIVLTLELRIFEARYRTALNLALESAIAEVPQDEQNERMTDLVRLLWSSEEGH